MDDIVATIFTWAMIAILAPMLVGVLVAGVIFGGGPAWISIAWYIVFNLILWGLTFMGLWYFIFSAGFLSYIIYDILIHWGEISYWSDSMHISF